MNKEYATITIFPVGMPFEADYPLETVEDKGRLMHDLCAFADNGTSLYLTFKKGCNG